MCNPVSDLSQAICWCRAGAHMSSLDATARIADYIRTVVMIADQLSTPQRDYLHGVLDGL